MDSVLTRICVTLIPIYKCKWSVCCCISGFKWKLVIAIFRSIFEFSKVYQQINFISLSMIKIIILWFCASILLFASHPGGAKTWLIFCFHLTKSQVRTQPWWIFDNLLFLASWFWQKSSFGSFGAFITQPLASTSVFRIHKKNDSRERGLRRDMIYFFLTILKNF